VGDSAAAWTYLGALPNNVTRPMNGGGVGSGLNNRVSFISCLPIFPLTVNRGYWMSPAAVAGAFCFAGYGLDSTNTFTNSHLFFLQAAVSVSESKHVTGYIAPQTGFHFIQALERGDGTRDVQYAGQTQNKFFEVLAWQ